MLIKCKTKGCLGRWHKNSSNITKVICLECSTRKKGLKKVSLKTFAVRYKELGKKERETLYYIICTIELEKPTINQIKDISGSLGANWRIVKENLDLRKLTSDKKYYNFK